jgi:hypothetical protein
MPTQNEGLITKIFSWFTHASYDKSTTKEWLYGLALILIVAFLWSTVVRQTVETSVDVLGNTLKAA